MVRRQRTHIGEDNVVKSGLKPAHLSKLEFARRLYRLMLERGWNQSELARNSGLTRDAISTYMTGKSLPTNQSVIQLAQALGVEPIEILPNIVENAIEQDIPSLELRVSNNEPGKAWLRINRLVTMPAATAIVDILNKDDAISN